MSPAAPPVLDVQPHTHTFKQIAGTPLRADLYRPTLDAQPTPIIVWFHGGGLIFGSRRWLNPKVLTRYLAARFAVLTVDYRLAPETKLAAILEDVDDALAWVRQNGHRLGVDPRQLIVMGESAGGYLSLVAGHRSSPRPRAVVSLYGYGDITGAWYATPSRFYNRQPPVERTAAEALIGQAPIVDAPGLDRLPYYIYCRQHGLWPNAVVGRDPVAEPAAFAPFCPAWNVDASYPPTILVHGTKDDDVPYAQSRMMARALARAGVEYHLHRVWNAGHGFDADSPAGRRAHEAVLEFLSRYVRRD